MESQIITFHNPDEPYGYFSNWYLSDFTWRGIQFSSLEQYMMYQKAITFHDNESAERILSTDDVAAIKQMGREVRNYDNVIWNGVRQVLVYEGMLAKFSQNEELKQLLLDTGDAMLAEAAVNDRIWGIGLSMKDPERLDMKNWTGQNLMGFNLMLVREKLKFEQL